MAALFSMGLCLMCEPEGSSHSRPESGAPEPVRAAGVQGQVQGHQHGQIPGDPVPAVRGGHRVFRGAGGPAVRPRGAAHHSFAGAAPRLFAFAQLSDVQDLHQWIAGLRLWYRERTDCTSSSHLALS